MNKTLKIVMTIAMVLSMVFTFSNVTFAANNSNSGASASDIINGITVTTPDTNQTQGLMSMAGRVIGLIQIASAVLAVILIAVFGFKFIMGSANEKADYQKSFIPLIVGLVVVFAATSIAKLIMSVAVSQ